MSNIISKLINLAGNITGTLGVVNGGTGDTTLTSNGVLYGNGTSAVGAVAAGSTGQVLQATTSSAPTWAAIAGNGTLLTPASTTLLTNGTRSGTVFTISTTTTCATGDTYKDNNGSGSTYTVIQGFTSESGQVLFMSGTGTSPITPLARQTGSGTSSISFTASQALTSYTVPTPAPLYMIATAVGGGGGGGNAVGDSTHWIAGAGGGAASIGISQINNPIAGATYYYTVGAGGAGATGNGSLNTGGTGTNSIFSVNTAVGNGGAGGSGSNNGINIGSSSITTAGVGGINVIPGAAGASGTVTTQASNISGYFQGGSCLYGAGAQSSLNAAGNTGTGYGSGGSGGLSASNSSNYAGGTGAAGTIILQLNYQ